MYTSFMLLLCCSAASALDWWVEDLDEAVAVTTVLQNDWPGSDVHVLVGPVGTRGVWYADGELHLEDGEVSRSEPVGPDLHSQVLLVRSWTRDLEPRDGGWVPVPEPVVETLPDPELADVEQTSFRVGVTGGPGLPWHGPPLRVAGEVGVRARSVTVSAVFVGDLAEQLYSNDSLAWTGRRIGVGAQAGWYKPLRYGAIEPTLSAQTRWLRYVDELDEPVLRLAVPGAVARVRWWGEPLDNVAVGVGLALTVEGTVLLGERVFRVGDTQTLYFEPITAQLEFHVARELRSS